jgi:phage-related minor tail protein
MGEAGPEAIMPLTRIGGKLGVRAAGGGGSVVNIDARYATEGTAEMIVKAIQRAAPGIVKQSVSANRAAGARGY